MDWEFLGFKHYPFSVNPIATKTLELFTGHKKEVQISSNVLSDANVRLIIEGARGVGTTSFANYVKFTAQKKKYYLAPRVEVSVEPHWGLESLLTAVISSIVREMEIIDGGLGRTKVLMEAKALCNRLSEAYNNFGVTAFSVGGSFGKPPTVSQPSFIPSTTLGHHLADLGQLAMKRGYRHGILVQLNNLDLNVVHTEEHLTYLFNALRDFMQIEGVSWLLVGDVGLSAFIASNVDRLDDIISDRVLIQPPGKKDFHQLIAKRIAYYRTSKQAEFPLEQDVFDYLYDLTGGRLRYIFGLVYSLLNRLQVGKLVRQVSLNLAKEAIAGLAQERVARFDLSGAQLSVIRYLVRQGEANVAMIVKETGKNRTYISKLMAQLLDKKCVLVRREGTQRLYCPTLEAKIAFSLS